METTLRHAMTPEELKECDVAICGRKKYIFEGGINPYRHYMVSSAFGYGTQDL